MYSVPTIDRLEITVEQGFAASPLPPAGDFDGTTPDTGN